MKDNWPEIEKRLLNLLHKSKDYLDDINTDVLEDFIENREYGVAYEWIVSLVAEGKLVLDLETATELSAAGNLMGFVTNSSGDSVR